VNKEKVKKNWKNNILFIYLFFLGIYFNSFIFFFIFILFSILSSVYQEKNGIRIRMVVSRVRKEDIAMHHPLTHV
jgi:hypothetical protein